ncbi:hypothetical protein GeomeDRAFT_2198 [Geobacter metallireducens RCH3]|uniref:PatA-like N-terminal domain-containing protein n=1 Tax=Geobacter metallireducens (strain ATCC 53774 / DSM 7210 / GS-15) TaxID=269799 RepID=Q39Z18_GEOMG|nr:MULTISPECIES: DUF4388 domain-containing protein [Geobacter]ABB30506.1 hypothetical protein Gmet_0261 [Geobacter metallireducens GS-15]EHP85947.1 hypothetical protein GeomeDRAFT_2198 [Geobacter metallireducens RCH3]MBT1076815.1 DUF4388 domain-containing protein [Geobacter grbiciae]
MSFTGDLEHLSIVDVIQLLHATRKSGALTVKGRKGESQLVFSDGYIISSNHYDNSLRIGNILVEAGVITAETLATALEEQRNAGANRRPLVATLIEGGRVRKEDAYRGLEALIELTVVEILTWKRGTFDLDVSNVTVSDEYRYFPENLHQEITLHAENVLMDALRIFDEKMRDGLLVVEEITDEPLPPETSAEEGGFVISADDLGLADVDKLEKSIPKVFAGLEDRTPHLKIQELGADLSDKEREELLAFLGSYSGMVEDREGTVPSVVFFSADELMAYCVTTACRKDGISVLATSDEQDLDPIIDQLLTKKALPVIVFDTPDSVGVQYSPHKLEGLRLLKQKAHPQIAMLQLVSPGDYVFTLDSLKEGARAVFPRPVREERGETFLEDTLRFLGALPAYLRAMGRDQGSTPAARIATSVAALRGLGEPPEIALSLLQSVAGELDRALTLIVRDTELIAERSIGIRGDRQDGASPPLRFTIPLAQPSLFTKVIEKRGAFFGKTDDEIVRGHLFAAIGAPLNPTVFLLPLESFGKTVSLIYGDFGQGEPAPVPVDFLEILAGEAGIVLENAVYRRKREKPHP